MLSFVHSFLNSLSNKISLQSLRNITTLFVAVSRCLVATGYPLQSSTVLLQQSLVFTRCTCIPVILSLLAIPRGGHSRIESKLYHGELWLINTILHEHTVFFRFIFEAFEWLLSPYALKSVSRYSLFVPNEKKACNVFKFKKTPD